MTTISPTPLPVSLFHSSRPRHAPLRTFPRSQPRKPQSPSGVFSQGHGFSSDAPMIKDISIGDSSDDDEIPQPMNFSALTRAILEDKSSTKSHSPQVLASDNKHQLTHKDDQKTTYSRSGTPLRGNLRITRKSPPVSTTISAGNPSPSAAPRIVHLSGSRNVNSLRRSLSSSDAKLAPSLLEAQTDPPLELITPAPAPRHRPALRSRANSPTSVAGVSVYSNSIGSRSGIDSRSSKEQDNIPREEGAGHGDWSPQDDVQKSRSKTPGEGLTGSTRLKRVPLGSGTFLRGAPMRRPLRRPQSEEDESPDQHGSFLRQNAQDLAPDQLQQQQQQQPLEHNVLTKDSSAPVAIQDFARTAGSESQRQPLQRSSSTNSRQKRLSANGSISPVSKAASPPKSTSRPVGKAGTESAEFKMSAPPVLPSAHDQENEPPPTFKRNKPAAHVSLVGRDQFPLVTDPNKSKMLIETAAIKSPPRRNALAAKSINTPQRAPPPPPKMSVLETATAAAGASTVKSKKKKTHITINGKTFYLRGRLGRGGSSDVYRVMTDNDKMFAWKKVNLQDCNEDTVRGYKGEIDLLKKLENVDRVVRLFDWEVHEEKQSLSVLMEAGESDLNRILAGRLQPENATLDLPFLRHYWAEMLQCVAAVHAHDIVHSDLKPANFLLVQGRLKLIDFGIANAIDTENTVNVHRENNVGTPNYMSPESLQDTNASADRSKASTGPGLPKLMKLGKPSDVWSLGCILYQMTYGKPPFAHIANQWNRVLAITNPTVAISFPSAGIGEVPVPSSLQRVLQSCLNRDPSQRPSLEYLLSEREPFLHPEAQIKRWDAEGAVPVTENILEQIIGKIVERCRDGSRGFPTEEEKKVYSKAFLDRIRALQRV